MNYLDKQIREAKDNYNYFFIKLIFGILKIIFKLTVVLLISNIFNYTIINIIAIFYTFYSIYDISSTCKYYFNIINEIKNTLGFNNLVFEIDLNLINRSFVKSVVKYGK